MDGTLTLENIETTREIALNLCDTMILHLKSGISKDNINILIGIVNKMSKILDSIMEQICIDSLTEKTEQKKDTPTEKTELKKDTNDTYLESKGRFTVIGTAPPYTYYNHQL